MAGPSVELENLRKLSTQLLAGQNFDYLAVAVIDFNRSKLQSFELNNQIDRNDAKVLSPFVFDLASLTKPLMLNLCYLMHPQAFTPDLLLLLEHRGGLPSWGRLSKKNWREVIASFPIKESVVEYSDFSALRLMLELESKFSGSFLQHCKTGWHEGVQFWTELTNTAHCLPTGMRGGAEIRGQVHDDNAFNISTICSHAGLFSDVHSLGKTLININDKFNLLALIKPKLVGAQRFVLGWDRALDLENTLAGQGCSNKTFGHLGFTGTSIWIDGSRGLGHIILSNATQNYWYDRSGLNTLRRSIGSFIWNNKWN